jgi:hypothetical protein
MREVRGRLPVVEVGLLLGLGVQRDEAAANDDDSGTSSARRSASLGLGEESREVRGNVRRREGVCGGGVGGWEC